MEDIENLVAILYAQGTPPETLRQAQRSLQLAQKSPNGWDLAKSLLMSTNPQAQFLGAQTFIVKLNDGKGLPPYDQQHADLLGWLKTAVDTGMAPFVTRKLLGAITKLYLSSDWNEAPFAVVEILGTKSPLTYEFLNFLVEDSELSAADLRAKLVPEVSNLVSSLLKESQLRSIGAINLLEVWSLTFFDNFQEMLPDLVVLAQTLLSSTNQTNCELVAALFNALSSIYMNSWRDWPIPARKKLSELFMLVSQMYQELPPDYADDEVFMSVARLIIAVGQENIEAISCLLPFLMRLAAAPLPIVDDPLATDVLEFWNQYTEEIISSALSSSNSTEDSRVIASVISGYWPRIKLYPELRSSDWDEFSSFRKDFADFLELSYPILGSQLFDQLTNVVLSSLGTETGQVDWLSIESGLYCLNGLADIIGEDYRGDKPELRSVQRIFQSSLWSLLPDCKNDRVRQTTVNLIGCFVDFFQSPEGKQYMPTTLNYLFTCLDSVTLQNTASRSIQRLCDTCQTELVDEVPAFLSVYASIRSKLQSVPHVRTVGAIAGVIQATEALEPRANALEHLISLVVTSASADPDVSPLDLERTHLKCLAAIGKHSQSGDTTTTTNGSAAGGLPRSSTYWDEVSNFWKLNAPSQRIKSILNQKITEAIESSDLPLVEAACDILKAGITAGMGPFYFDEEFVISFVVTKSSKGPLTIIPPVLDLARFYLMSRLASVRQNAGPNFTQKELQPIMSVLLAQGETSLSAALDVLVQFVYIAAHLDIPFVDLVPGAQESVELALIGISSSDRFILRSAATFWKEYLGSPASLVPSPGPQEKNLDVRVAVRLVQVLIFQIAGGSSRSDLGPLTEILRALIVKHPLIGSQLLKRQLVDAPDSKNVLKLDLKTRSDFVAQIVLVKGGRKSFDLVQRLWSKVRGIPENYDPHITVL